MTNYTSTGAFYVPVSGLPSTQSGVESIQNQVLGMIASTDEPEFSFFIQKQLVRLNELYNLCLASEQRLYDIFNVRSIEELQNRFNQLLNSNLVQISNINLQPLMNQLRIKIGKAMDDRIINVLNSPAILSDILNNQKLTNQIQQRVGAILQSNLSQVFSTFGSKATGFKQSAESSPNNLIFSIDDYVHIVNNQVEKIQDLTPWMRNRILMAISNMQGRPRVELTKEDVARIFSEAGVTQLSAFADINIKNEITGLVRAYLPDVDAELLQTLVNDISNNLASYALSPTISSNKDFIGKLQFNLLLKSAFPGITTAGEEAIGRVLQIGTLNNMSTKNTGVNTILRVDLNGVMEKFNFQVRDMNSLISSGGNQHWEYTGQGTMDSILNRAGIPNGGLFDKFYASWSFNTIFPPDKPHWPGSYPSTYGRFAEIAGRMDRIFVAYADKILRVDQFFQAKDDASNLFPKGMYVNTLFSFSGKLVPSSSIISGLMTSLSHPDQQQLINFQIESVDQRQNAGNDTLIGVIHRYSHSPHPPTYAANITQATKNVFMKYKVIVDLTAILPSLF